MRAWVKADPETIAACVTPDCVAIECYGPVYQGRDRILQWADSWIAAGGIVHSWTLIDQFATHDHEVAQWEFECTWQNNRTTFEGCTIATIEHGLLSQFREYQTTATLYN